MDSRFLISWGRQRARLGCAVVRVIPKAATHLKASRDEFFRVLPTPGLLP